eukprot:tig00000492_g1429.t1
MASAAAAATTLLLLSLMSAATIVVIFGSPTLLPAPPDGDDSSGGTGGACPADEPPKCVAIQAIACAGVFAPSDLAGEEARRAVVGAAVDSVNGLALVAMHTGAAAKVVVWDYRQGALHLGGARGHQQALEGQRGRRGGVRLGGRVVSLERPAVEDEDEAEGPRDGDGAIVVAGAAGPGLPLGGDLADVGRVTSKVNLIVGGLIGGIFLLVGTAWAISRARSNAHTSAATATVTRVHACSRGGSKDSSTPTYTCDVDISFVTAGGVRVDDRRISIQRSGSAYRAGDGVEVRYDPANPAGSVHQPWPHFAFVVGILFVVGVIILVASVSQWYIARSSKAGAVFVGGANALRMLRK